MIGVRRMAVLAACALGGGAVLDVPAEAAKPKAKACKKGTVKVKTGKTTRCVKLRLAPPTPKSADSGKQAFDRLLSAQWPTLKDRRGRKVRSPAQELRRVPGGMAKVRAAIAKGLKLAAARRPGAAKAARRPGAARAARRPGAAEAARAGAGRRGGAGAVWGAAWAGTDGSGVDTAWAADGGGGSVTGIGGEPGGDLGFNADVPAGAYRILLTYRTNDLGNGFIQGARCPTAAGSMKGDSDVKTLIAITITRGGLPIMGTSTEMADRAHYEAHVADDAKLDTIDIDHTGTVSARMTGGGHSAVSVRMRARRTAQVDMRTRRYTSSPRQFDVSAEVDGASREVAASLEADLARRLSAGTDDAFAGVVGSGMGQYRQIEYEVNANGRCVQMAFEPRLDPSKTYKKGETGTFDVYMKPNVDPNNRAPGRFTVVRKQYVSATPETVAGTSPSISFTVLDDVERNGYVSIRATSKAGVVDLGTRDIPIEVGAPRYRVTSLTYTDQLSLDGIAPFGGCAPSTSQGNTTTLLPSGAEQDGALSAPLPEPIGHGEQTGLITAKGKIQKQVAFTGCKWNDTVSARVPCQLQNSGSEEVFVNVDLFVDTGFGAAKLTWHVRPANIGDVPPIISPCEVAAAQALNPVTTAKSEVPRAALFDPGPHTLSVDVPFEEPRPAPLSGTLRSTAHYAITIERL